MWHVFESTGEDSRPKSLLTKSVRISLLTYPEYSQPNKNRFILAMAMQFGGVAAVWYSFDFGERNTQFSRVIFEINPLFTFEVTFQSQISSISVLKILDFRCVKMQQLMTDNMQFTELF